MAKDYEVEEGREVVRRTIVGGRPRSREKRKIRVPIGLEKVLCRAAGDTAFREALLRDRGAAVDGSGFALLASERAVLDSVPPAALETMIANIDVRTHGRKRFMRGVMAVAFAATATVGVADCGGSAGSKPDWPEPDVAVDTTPAADGTVTSDADPSRGISPDVFTEPDVIDSPDVTADEGIRPDVVDAGDPVPLGILPDIDE